MVALVGVHLAVRLASRLRCFGSHTLTTANGRLTVIKIKISIRVRCISG